MRFYYVKDEYIEYLRKFDKKVAKNKSQSRPYVGVVFEVNNIKYYAPFASPKTKHMKMKNSIDFRKINQGKYGAINFNNMIPVTDEALVEIDIDQIEDEKYRRLLQNQYRYIRAEQQQIKNAAEKLHRVAFLQEKDLSKYEQSVKRRICNLVLLEQVYDIWCQND